jgi:hypothetical protein
MACSRLTFENAVNLYFVDLQKLYSLRAIQRRANHGLPQLVFFLAGISHACSFGSVCSDVNYFLGNVVVIVVVFKVVEIMGLLLGVAAGIAIIGDDVGLGLESTVTLALHSEQKDTETRANGNLIKVEHFFAVIDIFAGAKDGNLFLAVEECAVSPTNDPLVVAEIEANRNVALLEGNAASSCVVCKLLAIGRWGDPAISS